MSRLRIALVLLWLACNNAECRLSFLALGDFGARSSRQKNVAQSMADWATGNKPAFVVTLGDNFYPDGIKSSSDSLIDKTWRQMYNQASLKSLTWYPSLGNHDYHYHREFNQVLLSQKEKRWRLPNLWHSFVRNDGGVSTHFIIVDTEAIYKRRNNYKTQLSWLESELKYSNSDYIFVFGHRNIFSVGRYGPYSKTMRRVLRPLLEKYNVDIYFCGHDHNQQRFRQANGQGVDYVLHGGGGRSLYPLNLKNTAALRKIGIETKYARSRGGFLGVIVDSKQVIVQFRGSNGSLYHSFVRKNKRAR